MPLETLTGGIQAVRAHFYAAYHSGRRKSAPLSRGCLQNLTEVPERTQRAYDHIAGIRREKNMAIGPRYTKETAENQAWRRGRGMFHFIDSQGQQGPQKRRLRGLAFAQQLHRTAPAALPRAAEKNQSTTE